MPSIKFGLGSTSTFDFSLLSRDPQSEIHKIGMYSSIGRMKQEFLISESRESWESCKNAFELCDTMRKKTGCNMNRKYAI